MRFQAHSLFCATKLGSSNMQCRKRMRKPDLATRHYFPFSHFCLSTMYCVAKLTNKGVWSWLMETSIVSGCSPLNHFWHQKFWQECQLKSIWRLKGKGKIWFDILQCGNCFFHLCFQLTIIMKMLIWLFQKYFWCKIISYLLYKTVSRLLDNLHID